MTNAAHPSETVTHTYDEQGRLIRAARSGSINDGVATDYEYDKADNRTRRTVTGSTGAIPNAPTFAVNDASAAESSSIVFTVTRSAPTTGAYDVTYATADSSAVSGSDYTEKIGTLSFASGQTSKTVSVSTLPDTVSEGNETLFLNLIGATGGAGFTDNQGVGTITDVPFFSIGDASANEGLTLSFTVTRNGSTTGSYSVNYATANNTASAGSDYTAASGTLTFTAGQTSKTVSVTALSDAVTEGNETFFVNLSGATGNAQISDSQGLGAILPPPSFSVSDAGAEEGSALSFIVTKSGTATGTYTVNYATANGTAIAPGDYGAASATLTFTASETSKIVNINTVGDSVNGESSETMFLNLSAPSGGATIVGGQGVGTITNVLLCGGVPC